MALNIFILLTLLMLALSTSQGVGLTSSSFATSSASSSASAATAGKQESGCSFGGTCVPSGSTLEEAACVKLKCTDGTWHYTPGDIDPNCGKCNLEGDPHITTFDKSRIKYRDGETIASKYILKRGGHYVISQPDFNVPASYGVKGIFVDCDWLFPYNGSCIHVASYNEPGITITLILPPRDIAATCTYGDPDRDPKCDIKVLVKGEYIPIGDSVEYLYGLNGAILVFKHNDIGEDNRNLNCITIVGSKGLSVSLCEYQKNLPSFYVWALPSLKSKPYKLYGLCNTFTGEEQNNFVLQDDTVVPSEDCLTWTSDDGEGWEICKGFSESWKFPIG